MSRLSGTLLVIAATAMTGLALAADEPPKASPTPKASSTPKASTKPKASTTPKASPTPKATQPPPQMTPEQKAQMEAYAKAGTPGSEHKMLAGTVGHYSVNTKSWETPDGPAVEEKGTAKRSMALDGRVLVEDFTGTMMGAPFTGHGMTGYDNVSGKYWSTWNDSMSTGIAVSEGTCDTKKSCTFNGSYSDAIKGGSVKMRMTSRWITPNKEIFEMYGPDKAGNEMKVMEMTYTKETGPTPK